MKATYSKTARARRHFTRASGLAGVLALGLVAGSAGPAPATAQPGPPPRPMAGPPGLGPSAPPSMPGPYLGPGGRGPDRDFMPPPPPPIERVFESLDVDRDGIVTIDEALKNATGLFVAIDQSKDGILDKGEFESWFGRASAEAARFVLALHDIDGDGKVTRAEFESPIRKRFALFDRNDDGKVTPEELAHAKMMIGPGFQAGPMPPLPPPAEARMPTPMQAMPGAMPPFPPPSSEQYPRAYPPQAMPGGPRQFPGSAYPPPPVSQNWGTGPGWMPPGGQGERPRAWQGGPDPLFMPPGVSR